MNVETSGVIGRLKLPETVDDAPITPLTWNIKAVQYL